MILLTGFTLYILFSYHLFHRFFTILKWTYFFSFFQSSTPGDKFVNQYDLIYIFKQGISSTLSEYDESVAKVEAEDHEEEEDGDDHDHDHEEHGMALHVIGGSAGSTSFKLQLMHEGHADYTSTNNVPVVVN